MGKGGGSPAPQQPTNQTVTQTNLPAWAQPYSEQLLGKAAALTDINQNPYQTYQGQRLAGFAPLQQQAFQNIGGMQVSPQTGQASGLAGMAGVGGLGAGQGYAQMATDPTAISAYMSPYMQNVVDYQKQQAIKDYSRALPGLGAQAGRSGAFGGSRHGLVESEAQRNLQNQLAGIGATGAQNAFQQAQQAQQFGANLGMQGLGLAGQAAQTLGQLGQQQYAQQMGITAAQQQAGAQQQAMEQQRLTNQYQDFLNQMNYPYQQLSFMSDILHGTPTGGITTQQQYQAQPSLFSQIAGGLGGIGSLLGAYNAANKAEGGIIGYKEGGEVGYADGGVTDLADFNFAKPSNKAVVDYQMGQAKKGLPTMIPFSTLSALDNEFKRLQQIPAGSPQTTVAQDLAMQVLAQSRPQSIDQGLGSLPAPNLDQEETFSAANGGIIAFSGGKKVPSPEEIAETKAVLQELQQGNEERERQAKEIIRRESMPDGGGAIPTQAVIPDYRPYKPDFVAQPEGIASQVLSAVTGSRPAYGAQNAPSFTSDEQPESAIRAWFRQQREGSQKYLAEEQARQDALRNMYKSIVSPFEAVTPTQRRERETAAEQYRQQSMRSGIATPMQTNATPTQADLDNAGKIATAPVEISPERRAELERQKAAGEGYWKKTAAPAVAPTADPAEKEPSFLDKVQEQLFNSLKSDTVMSRDEYDKRMDNIAKKYGVDPESTKQFFDNQAKSLTDQVAQARKDRNVNLWMAAAQGFFAMAGGVSPNALKNFADGMGVGTKQATAALNEFNKDQSEINKAQRELAKLQLIDRREMSKAEQDREVKYEKMVADHRDRQTKTLSTLFVGGTQREATKAQNAFTNELKQQQLASQNAAKYELARQKSTILSGLDKELAKSSDPAKAKAAQDRINAEEARLKKLFGIEDDTVSPGFDPSAVSAELARRGVK